MGQDNPAQGNTRATPWVHPTKPFKPQQGETLIFEAGALSLPPCFGAQWQLIQFGPRFTPSWVMLLKDGHETFAVRRFQ